jgi:hypothetical protein
MGVRYAYRCNLSEHVGQPLHRKHELKEVRQRRGEVRGHASHG